MLIYLAWMGPVSAQEADLVVVDLTFSPQTINAGAHPTSVTYAYGNAGPDDIDADSVTTTLYLSRNTSFGDSDDIQIWQSERFWGYLGAGDAYSFTLNASSLAQITIPANASGRYYVIVFVDHSQSSSYYDPDISDNSLRTVGTITVNAAPRARLAGAFVSQQGFQLTVSGVGGTSYRLEGSADLVTWEEITTVVTDSQGTAQYLDTAATALDQRFYRAVQVSQ